MQSNRLVATQRERGGERERESKKMALISMRITVVSWWVFLLATPAAVVGSYGEDPPTPAAWPERFHALLYMNLSDGRLQMSDLWYDWPAGRNVNLMQKQLGVLLHDVEWDNGTSFYYTLGPTRYCRTTLFPVGIPRRDFMLGSTYLGLRYTDGFLCHLWEKVDFIWYYEDASTRRPVRWDFYDGISTHVMTFEVGVALEEPQWQAPSYCFTDDRDGEDPSRKTDGSEGATANDLLPHSLRKLV